MTLIFVVIAAIFAVVIMTAGGRALLVWAGTAFKPFVGVIIFLISAHYTILRHMVTSRSIIFPSLVKKTVYRDL